MAVSTAMPRAVTDLGGLRWYGWGFSAFLIVQLVGSVVGARCPTVAERRCRP